MFCGSAAGTMMPPMVVYKALNVYQRWRERGPKGAKFMCSKSGWFDSFLFRCWFFDCALPMLKRLPGKKVLLGDNLASHISAEVIDSCRANNIEFVCLPPYSTDKLQPLDVAIFGPLKNSWRSVLREHKLKNPNDVGLNKCDFPPLLEKTLTAADLGKHLPSGFRKCGLVPVDRSEALSRIPSRDMEVDSEEVRRIMDSTLGERLEQLRGVDRPAASKGRGKKVTVQAGRSFTAVESSEEEEELPDLDVDVPDDAEEEVETGTGTARANVFFKTGGSKKSKKKKTLAVSKVQPRKKKPVPETKTSKFLHIIKRRS